MNKFKFGEFVGWTCSVAFATAGVTKFGLKADLVLYLLAIIFMEFARKMRAYSRKIDELNNQVENFVSQAVDELEEE